MSPLALDKTRLRVLKQSCHASDHTDRITAPFQDAGLMIPAVTVTHTNTLTIPR